METLNPPYQMLNTSTTDRQLKQITRSPLKEWIFNDPNFFFGISI
jgi:hypothetical protein